MNIRQTITTITLVLLIACPLAGADYLVDQVRFQGTRNVDVAALRVQLKHLSGQISQTMITEDLKNLYRTEFFDQIQVSAEPVSNRPGHVDLVYAVTEKPIVRKTFVNGNDKVDSDELGKILTFGAKRFLDKSKIDALMRNAKELYKSRGYYDAELEYSVLPGEEGQVDVTFTVKEGSKVKVREIRIRGLKALDADDLLPKLQTKRYKWWNSWLLGTGRLSEEVLEDDKTTIRQYFLDHGYIDATISEPEIQRKKDGFYVTFEAKEGELYSIGNVQASGDLIDDNSEKTLAEIKSVSGSVFSASAMREDALLISDKFSDFGYAFANVIPDTEINREQKTINVNFRTSRGKLVKVGKINITGNDKTYDNVIRRELKIEEQQTYSGAKVKRSQALLQRLGYFEEVNISSAPTNKDDEVDLNVNVREASTGSFTAGAGYSTSDGALFNARLAENNLMGTGRSAQINFDIGTQRDNLVLSVDDRRFNDTHLALGTDLYRTDREFTDFERRMTGAAINAGYPLEEIFGESYEDIMFNTRYEYDEIDIRDVDPEDAADLVIASEGKSTVSSIAPRLTRNTINNPLDPSEGSIQELGIELAGAGGDQEFYLVEAKNTIYQKLADMGASSLVLSWRTRFDYGESLNDDPFPLFRRFFPGGINSVRGFKARRLGPKDSRGNEYGGSKELINNFDLIFPLVTSAGVKGVIFHDLGEAFDDNESVNFADLRQAYGFGLRWSSPIGPIRIEFGFPVDREEGESSMVTQFSFGAPL